ncbi:MAG: Rrf2 family transcriptional regulator [Schleiferiaceae bacterium]|nr:Rrf2 family transcriptional regulator [Schleiferiaceae bacterium]
MLNRKTTYGIHALLFLARHADQGFIPIVRISESLVVSRKFLERILAELKEEGLVVSHAGRDGGYSLGSQGLDLGLSEVVRVLEGPIALLPCASHRFFTACNECPDPNSCGLQDALVQVRNDTVHSLKQMTLGRMLTAEAEMNSGLRPLQRPTPYSRD